MSIEEKQQNKRQINGKKKKYRPVVYINGKKHYGRWTDRKTDAQTEHAELEIEKRNIEVLGLKSSRLIEKITLKAYSIEFLNQKKANTTLKTLSRYESNIRIHVLPFLGEKHLRELTKKDGIDFINSLKGNHKDSGINCIMQTFKALLNNAVDDDYLEFSPFSKIPKLKIDDQSYSFWEREVVERFLRFHENNIRKTLYLIPIYTGMRLGEVCGLQWKHIDFKNKKITIKQQRQKQEGELLTSLPKSKKVRIIPLPPDLEIYLSDLKVKAENKSEYIVLNCQGNLIDPKKIYRYFKKDQQSANLKESEIITYHDLRHTFASHFMMNGGDIYELKEILGHSRVEETTRYVHLSSNHLQGTAKYMGMGKGFLKYQKNDVPNLSPRKYLRLLTS